MMIRQMLNLECEDGHKWFSPTPDERVGHECGFAATSAGKHKCNKPLKRIKSERERSGWLPKAQRAEKKAKPKPQRKKVAA